MRWDTHGYFTGDYGDLSPNSVLKRRNGVCSGYANLFDSLVKKMEIVSFVVSGFAKGYGYSQKEKISDDSANHAWNAVYIEDAWYLLDSTWGSGYAKPGKRGELVFLKKLNDYYFLTPPENFICSHLPKQEYAQLLDPPITIEEFKQLKKPFFYSTRKTQNKK
ncbi:hypothetical protein ISS22_17075 [candidate division KSB1 bacterium]|nr:hypothetical protein [candidate division KSB1 bacterium]